MPSDKPTLTQQMLAVAREVQAGRAEPGTLQPFVEQLQGGMVTAQVQFVRDASGNPEVPQETIPVVMQAFERFQQGLDAMTAGLASGGVHQVLEGAGIVEEASATIRAARDSYQQALTQGPSPFPFVNRLILHAETLARGSEDTRYALAALEELPDFLRRIAQDVELQEERVSYAEARQAAEAATEEIRQVAEGFGQGLQSWNQASEVQRRSWIQQITGRLTAAAEQLAGALGAYVETDLANGPTPILVVNLVIRSFENWQAGIIGPDEFRRVLQQAQTAMHDMLAQLPVEHARAAADHLEMVLARMEESVLTEGLAGVVAGIPTLHEAAHEVAAVSSSGMVLDEDDEVVDFVESEGRAHAPQGVMGLPANLQHILDVAQAYLGGQVGEGELLGVLDELERSVQGTQSKASATVSDASLIKPLQRGLNLLLEASQSLRTLTQQRDRRVVDAARSLLTQASETLLEVGGLST